MNDRTLQQVAIPLGLDFSSRPRLLLEELLVLAEPALIYEGHVVDADGEIAYVYTVGGRMSDGRVLEMGHTIEGDVIIVHGKDRVQTDEIACQGLHDTVTYLREEFASRGTLAHEDNTGIVADIALGKRR